jgi:hypothetical protein
VPIVSSPKKTGKNTTSKTRYPNRVTPITATAPDQKKEEDDPFGSRGKKTSR